MRFDDVDQFHRPSGAINRTSKKIERNYEVAPVFLVFRLAASLNHRATHIGIRSSDAHRSSRRAASANSV
jgi:hypothetical protein